uniref:tryptophan synthase n=1 Tax=uncultured organism TaxID=155900 RepID=M1Q0S9_9ZZZZ|nr:tryptophan synthase subunit alpha [uncultured organism]
MNRLTRAINRAKEEDGGAFIAYTMAGDPDPNGFLDYVKAIADGGADVIELGVPFSDPVADGPTIQAAGNRALASTKELKDVFDLARRARRSVEVPLVLMSYYNPVMQFGETRFLERCSDLGIDGVILPDLPVSEAQGYGERARENSVATPFLATPSTDANRLRKITAAASGFLYLVARPGTTGGKEEVGNLTTKAIESTSPEVPDELPVCVGFGLSSPKAVNKVVRAGADGAIVGSAIVEKIADGKSPKDLRDFVSTLKQGTKLR